MARRPEPSATTADVVSLSRFRRDPRAGVPEIDLGVFAEGEAAVRAETPAVDLPPGPRAVFLLGPGNVGKTTYARWLVWRMAERGGSASLAALDPGRRSLSTWFGDVAEPPTKDTTGTARYLADLLQATMEAKTSLLMDFGAGGDTALLRLMREAPDLVSAMQTEGVTPVAFYLTGPRVDDLDAMVQLEAAGFQPKATAILLNEGRIPDPSVLPEDAFAGITAHSRYRQLLTRGAVSIWLPRLDFETMTEIESKRLHFGQARDGQVPEGATFPPIGGLNRSRVRRWLDGMEHMHAPITTWLP
jgi:hypothetical protein